MFENVSRRTFLKGSAATAALAAAAGAGSLGLWQSQTARADELHETKEAPSLCNGCSSKCGLVATTVDGQLWTLRGSEDVYKRQVYELLKQHSSGLTALAFSLCPIRMPAAKPSRRKIHGTTRRARCGQCVFGHALYCRRCGDARGVAIAYVRRADCFGRG